MKSIAPSLLVLCALAAAAGGCRSAMPESEVQAVRDGALMKRDLRSYHLVYSEHRGAVGYLKVFDVTEAGGATFTWKYVYDKDFNELGWIDQFGNARRFHVYPDGAVPDPRTPIRVIAMPTDSIQRNTMRMLGIDPSTDDVSFPLAKDGDIGAAK